VSKQTQSYAVVEGQCAGPLVCPLSRIKAGTVVCIKELASSPELRSRLRELGFCEQQRIKLLSRHSNIICQVCNARLGISKRLAETIMVEALPAQMEAA
jgi:Fe2+ transport system protein FeoA